jgi:4-amino-4-deoxy-L-arabinose transferase-like glycosyltransferase
MGVSAFILLFMFVYFVFSSAKVSIKFKDMSAMRLIVLYYVRTFAWLIGAAITAVNVLRNRKGEAK